MAREFITAVEEKVDGGLQPVEVTLGRVIVDSEGEPVLGEDGEQQIEKRTLVCRPPKDGQVALLMARMGRHSGTNDKLAGIIDFFVGVLNEEDHQYVVTRLMDGEDPFGINDVTDVMTYIVEEWGKDRTR